LPNNNFANSDIRTIAVTHTGKNLMLKLNKLTCKTINTIAEHKRKKNKLLLFRDRKRFLASLFLPNEMFILSSGILFATQEYDICKIAEVEVKVIPTFPAITGPKKYKVTGVTKLKTKYPAIQLIE
jgi:hypothetical protein